MAEGLDFRSCLPWEKLNDILKMNYRYSLVQKIYNLDFFKEKYDVMLNLINVFCQQSFCDSNSSVWESLLTGSIVEGCVVNKIDGEIFDLDLMASVGCEITSAQQEAMFYHIDKSPAHLWLKIVDPEMMAVFSSLGSILICCRPQINEEFEDGGFFLSSSLNSYDTSQDLGPFPLIDLIFGAKGTFNKMLQGLVANLRLQKTQDVKVVDSSRSGVAMTTSLQMFYNPQAISPEYSLPQLIEYFASEELLREVFQVVTKTEEVDEKCLAMCQEMMMKMARACAIGDTIPERSGENSKEYQNETWEVEEEIAPHETHPQKAKLESLSLIKLGNSVNHSPQDQNGVNEALDVSNNSKPAASLNNLEPQKLSEDLKHNGREKKLVKDKSINDLPKERMESSPENTDVSHGYNHDNEDLFNYNEQRTNHFDSKDDKRRGNMEKENSLHRTTALEEELKTPMLDKPKLHSKDSNEDSVASSSSRGATGASVSNAGQAEGIKEGGTNQEDPSKHFQSHMMSMDVVQAIRCEGWPKIATPWITRPRKWPDEVKVTEIMTGGFHIVPKCSPGGRKEFEWRLSFTKAEISLFNSLGAFQKECYSILKAMYYNELTRPKVLASYYMKTIFLWACERLPTDCWTEDRLAEIVFSLLDDLLHCLVSGSCPHYFLPQHNLLVHVPHEFLLHHAKTVMDLRLHPDRYPSSQMQQRLRFLAREAQFIVPRELCPQWDDEEEAEDKVQVENETKQNTQQYGLEINLD